MNFGVAKINFSDIQKIQIPIIFFHKDKADGQNLKNLKSNRKNL